MQQKTSDDILGGRWGKVVPSGARSPAMLLTGNYRRSLDDKHRVAIPKQLRDAIEGERLFVTPGTDRALVVYPQLVLEQVGAALEKLSPAAPEARSFARLFYSQAQPAEIDRQGRLRFTPELVGFAGLTSEVVVVGVRDCFEIWDASHWDAFLNASQPGYDLLAERVLGEAKKLQEPRS